MHLVAALSWEDVCQASCRGSRYEDRMSRKPPFTISARHYPIIATAIAATPFSTIYICDTIAGRPTTTAHFDLFHRSSNRFDIVFPKLCEYKTNAPICKLVLMRTNGRHMQCGLTSRTRSAAAVASLRGEDGCFTPLPSLQANPLGHHLGAGPARPRGYSVKFAQRVSSRDIRDWWRELATW